MRRRNALLSGLIAVVLLCGLLPVHVPAQAAFTDVPEGAWYAEAVNWCREHGIVDDGTAFSPETVMTRAMVATTLYRASGSPTAAAAGFTDVPASSPDAAAVSWAAGAGVVNGYGDGTFKPDNPVTRQQFAAMLWRAAGSPTADTGIDYADENTISAYAKTAVDWARDTGVILGKNGNRFDPQGGATRAQAAVILYRYLTQDKNGRLSGEKSLSLTINGTTAEVKWERNASVDALLELTSQGPVTVSLSPYGGFEQVGHLNTSIPREDTQTTTDAGDIVLYQGNQIVIFYGSNSWSYTRLGHIENLNRQELRTLLGGDGVTAVFSRSADSGKPVVYMTSDISPEGLVNVYQALNWKPTGKTAVKLSTGEPPNSNYLRPELIGDLVKEVNGTIVECNTAYGGSRASSAMHKQVAADHGFTAITDFDLMDEDGEKSLPVTEGTRLNRAIVGSHIDNYDSFLILSHFKGHAMAGFGGAIKNVAIGMSSASGKVLVHTAGERTTGSIWYSDQDAWLEALPEMVTGVRDYVGAENIVYVNVMNRLSVDCDCDGNPAEPDMHDIGILASYDPVALDQACVDLVYAASDSASLRARMERQHGIHALEHGEEIGLGSRTYELVRLD